MGTGGNGEGKSGNDGKGKGVTEKVCRLARMWQDGDCACLHYGFHNFGSRATCHGCDAAM